jgi:hypothetical protein
MADFKNLKRHKTLGAPPPPEEASPNLSAPETAPAPPSTPTVISVVPEAKPKIRPVSKESPAPAPAAGQGRGRRDGRSLRKTGRTLQLATRVSPEFDARLRDIAERQGMLIVEVLEQALDAYEASHR